MEYCIVYLSSSNGLFSRQELTTILEQSQKNNSAQGITGVLLYCEGNIIQTLEGPEEKVKALYKVISQDRRHKQVVKLYGRVINQRLFGDWSMGYKTVSAMEIEHIKNLLNRPSELFGDQGAVLKLIQRFYRDNVRH